MRCDVIEVGDSVWLSSRLGCLAVGSSSSPMLRFAGSQVLLQGLEIGVHKNNGAWREGGGAGCCGKSMWGCRSSMKSENTWPNPPCAVLCTNATDAMRESAVCREGRRKSGGNFQTFPLREASRSVVNVVGCAERGPGERVPIITLLCSCSVGLEGTKGLPTSVSRVEKPPSIQHPTSTTSECELAANPTLYVFFHVLGCWWFRERANRRVLTNLGGVGKAVVRFAAEGQDGREHWGFWTTMRAGRSLM
ncbi:hypothetical protein B0T22DRAFT_117163 [Podospora appendiculata]|uniref:Uncharacterized protein n=1 Tax=Podospora appendiculata TaxID=314037 RepID=A0AAE0XM46_9PEZI|nr:hypothetical protein B0T22DRAFT_117163 [Podospora appendiculata]